MPESSGIVFEISNASPIALLLVLLTSIISSREFNAQRNAMAEPTRPEPIIEIRLISSLLFYY